ncbi:MAG: glutamyl-tRNA reductase [Bacteroidales bacterium]
MHLLLVGVSHRTAPVDLRERIDFSTRGVESAVASLAERASNAEAAVLSTCNRAEIYLAAPDPALAREDVLEFFREFHAVEPAEVTPHLYEREGVEAARHLFRVAAGLDSLVVGEPQILGQVKEAYSVASAQQSVGPLLNKLFHASFVAGKRVRTETSLGEGAVSVSYAAVSLARKIFGALIDRTVLVIGAGEMGKLTAQHLKAQGIARMLITSRTTSHAAALAEAMKATAIPWERMRAALGEADIVITATGASLPILVRADVAAIMRTRPNRPLFIIDIAVPRDVDSAAGDLEQVFLYNVDDLRAVVEENLTRRAAEVSRAETIVAEEADRFAGWLRSRGAIPTVVALRQRFEAIRRTELERLQHKLAPLSPEARARVDEITRLIIEKLLLTPTEQLKSLPDSDAIASHADALARLFSLDGAGQGSSAGEEREDEPLRARKRG